MLNPDEHLISFSAGISRENRSDIGFLMQEADRFATSTYDRDLHWQSWLNYFDSCLRKYGCERLTTITSRPLFVSDTKELDDLTLEVATFDDAQGLLDLGQEVLATLDIYAFVVAWLKTDGTGNARLGSWVVVPCSLNRRGEITLTTFAVQLRGRPMTTQHKPEAVLYMSGGVYTFHPQDYEPFRGEIREKLKGINLRKIVQGLDLVKVPNSPLCR